MIFEISALNYVGFEYIHASFSSRKVNEKSV